MIRIFILAALMLSACQTSGPKNIDVPIDSWDTAKPGTVVSQSSRKLENGFYHVSKSVINSSEHWEGIGHFGYVYYKKVEICQCVDGQTVRSPNGKYIVYYSNKKNLLELFNTYSKEITLLSDKYIGYPQTAEWDLKTKTAIIHFSGSTGREIKELKISLD